MSGKKIIIFFFCTLYSLAVCAQRNCPVHEYNESIQDPDMLNKFEKIIQTYKESFRITSNDTIVYTIPIVVHIIHNNSSGTIGGSNNPNITDEQILSQIEVLNEDFSKMEGTNGYNNHPNGADTKIKFCLASRDPEGNLSTGIVRVYNARHTFSLSNDALLKSLSYWPSDQYLNIWVARLSDGYLGWAQYPSGSGLPGLPSYDEGAKTDGIVISYQAFGRTGAVQFPYHFGRTATHEVGHWLGLRHIWGDGFCGNDYVDDTPEHEDANTKCLINFSSCNSFSQDMIENYLDYTPDLCMNIFTKGQTERMRSIMEVSPRRKKLLSSPGCCLGGKEFTIAFKEDFETGGYLENGWEAVNPDGGNTWTTTWPGAFGQSATSVYISNTGIYNSADPNNVSYDLLISPFLDFSTTLKPAMEFSYAYANPDGTTTETDSLVLSYNLSCNEQWLPIIKLSGNALVTASRTENGFIPYPEDWKKIRIALPALAGKRISRLRFESYSKAGNNIYLDDINIYKTSDQLILNAYPNPAGDFINIELIFNDDKDVKFEIYNSLGQLVLKEEDSQKISYTKIINTGSLSPGIYILKVTTNDQKGIKRILISH